VNSPTRGAAPSGRNERICHSGAVSFVRNKGATVARRSLTSSLFRLSRLARDVEVYSSGNPVRIGRRLKNKFLGRKLVSRIWRWP